MEGKCENCNKLPENLTDNIFLKYSHMHIYTCTCTTGFHSVNVSKCLFPLLHVLPVKLNFAIRLIFHSSTFDTHEINMLKSLH